MIIPTDYEVEDIDTKDYPDFSDAFISKAYHTDGKEYNEQELDALNDDDLLRYVLIMEAMK